MELVKNPTAKLGVEGGKWLLSMVHAAISKDEDYFEEMTDLRNQLSGEHYKLLDMASPEQVKMVINLSNAHVRSMVPTLFFKNPAVDCAPTAPQHSGKEATWNGLINNTLDKTDFAEECKKVVLDSVVYPEGVMKHAVNLPEDGGTTSETVSQQGPTVWLSKAAPINVRISPTQLIVDHLVRNRDVDSARFIAIRYRKPFHELAAHPIYGKNIDKSKLPNSPAEMSTSNVVKYTADGDDADWDENSRPRNGLTNEQMVTYYEVWVHQLISPDREGKYKLKKQMCVLMEGQDKPLRELTPWEDDAVMGQGFNRFPVTRLVLNEVPDDTAMSELGIFKSIQIGINWLVSRITSLVENDRLLYEVDPSKIKNMKKFRQQFYKGNARILVEVQELGAVNLQQPTFVGRDNYTLLGNLLQLLQQVSGFGQNRRGGSGIRTATEASLVDQGTQIKTDEKVDTVSKFLTKVIFKNTIILRNLAKKFGTSWVFRIAGDAGSVGWVNFSAEDIDWLPEVRIRVNSFRKMDSMQEMQKFAGLLQTAMQLFSIYGPRVRVDIIFSRMLEAAGIYDAGKIVGDQDAETMLQTLEIAGIIAGIPTPVLEVHDHAIHIKVIDAFANSPVAQQLIQGAPELLDLLMQHRQEHEAALQEAQGKAAQTSAIHENPFAAAGMSDNGNAQSAANQFTAQDRFTATPTPGGNGELQ